MDMKKTREELLDKILLCLEEKPLSIQEISRKVGSNWSTINLALEELKEERKVREVFSSKKIRIFRLTREDTYLDIPVSREGKKIGSYIYGKIKDKWIEKTGKLPTNTDVLKTAVNVLEKSGLDKEIPTVWYLFGKIPLLKYSQEIVYNEKIENSKKIDEEIEKSVELYSGKRTTHERMLQQYEIYHNELYKTKEKIRRLLNLDLDNEKILKELEREISNFYLCTPTKNDAAEVIEIIHEFVILLQKMILSLKKLNKFRQEINESFNSIWELLAIYMFFDSLNNHEKFKNREELAIYFKNSIQYRISSAGDFLSRLNSIYLNNLKEIPRKIDYTKEAEIIRNMFFEIGLEK